MTALKFAELTVKAGFPKGVVNIIPGSGKLMSSAHAEVANDLNHSPHI